MIINYKFNIDEVVRNTVFIVLRITHQIKQTITITRGVSIALLKVDDLAIHAMQYLYRYIAIF